MGGVSGRGPRSLLRAAALVTQEATWGHAPEIAAELGCSERRVQAWGEPQAERPGPAYQLLRFTRAALLCQQGRQKAIGPVCFVAEQLGLVVIDPGDVGGVEEGLMHAVIAVAGAAGRVLVEAEVALDDGRVTPAEVEAILRETRELRNRIYRLEARLVDVRDQSSRERS